LVSTSEIENEDVIYYITAFRREKLKEERKNRKKRKLTRRKERTLFKI
jgi:hypothetical protein